MIAASTYLRYTYCDFDPKCQMAKLTNFTHTAVVNLQCFPSLLVFLNFQEYNLDFTSNACNLTSQSKLKTYPFKTNRQKHLLSEMFSVRNYKLDSESKIQ